MVQSLRFGTALPRKVLGRVSFWKITGSSGSGSSRSEAETVDNGTFIGDLHRPRDVLTSPSDQLLIG
jgi:hypothetical protein